MNEAVIGLGTLGFWLFMAVLVAAIAWVVVRRAQIRHETLTKMIESGQNLDREFIEKILSYKNTSAQKEEKPYNPYKAGNEGAGFFFMIGFVVVLVGVVKKPVSYPMIVLGVLAMAWAHWVCR